MMPFSRRLSPLPTSTVLLLTLALAAPVQAAEVIGTIADLTGRVHLVRNDTPYRVAVGVPLTEADGLKTGSSGKVRVLLKDNSVLSIGPSSHVKLETFKPEQKNRTFSLDVLVGRFKMDIAKWFLGDTNGTIKTPTAVAGVRGTVVWGDTELDAICALSGSVEVAPKSAKDAGKQLEGGDCVAGMGDGKTDAIEPTPEQLAEYLAEVSIP